MIFLYVKGVVLNDYHCEIILNMILNCLCKACIIPNVFHIIPMQMSFIDCE